ncbi:NDP-sugar synthase [Hazenella sp. IB182353]|uniref:nucleotidyltransferase family protein n=1 Tax=Polycladospora coralii TaxID=2771432 RepID=UPI001747AE40|nr:NDP-sugar synthase [Polycladospora coralii]MBS7529174.1 NDP-sugar synthase [Polycladospora coralii]
MKKAVIMAGGQGKRLRPLTLKIPKPMVPIVNKPCLVYIVNHLKQSGFTEIIMTINKRNNMIKDYFQDGKAFGVKIHYVEEVEPLGTAGSIKNCAPLLNEPFLVISGDAVTNISIQEAIDFHQRAGGIATILLATVNNPTQFGMVLTNRDGRITRFLEKPKPSEIFGRTVNTGIYLFEPEILSHIDKEVAVDFGKNVFPNLLNTDEGLYGYCVKNYWNDIGTISEYFNTQFNLLNGEINIDIPQHMVGSKYYLDVHAQIHPTAEITPPVYIGAHAQIGPHVRIMPHTIIGDHVTISDNSELSNTIIWDHVYVGSHTKLNQTIVCNHTFIEGEVAINNKIIVSDHKNYILKQV